MQKLELDDILKNTSANLIKKVWYVAIVWRPNVGKSTFINSLIWEKVSITSNVPQTTRKRVLAIYNDIDSQIIFFDTPWIHKNTQLFNQKINNQAVTSMREAQVVLYFIDSSRPYWEEEKQIEELLEFVRAPIIYVYTKVDLESKIQIPERENVLKISSVEKTWFEKLLEKVKNHTENTNEEGGVGEYLLDFFHDKF